MNDTQYHNDFRAFSNEQIRELVMTVREVFGSNLSRSDFTDKLLMFLEDVPGYESGGVPSSLIESVWAEYVDRRS